MPRLLALGSGANVRDHGVARGFARREYRFYTRIGVGETLFRKCHDNVTIVSDNEDGNELCLGRFAMTIKQ